MPRKRTPVAPDPNNIFVDDDVDADDFAEYDDNVIHLDIAEIQKHAPAGLNVEGMVKAVRRNGRNVFLLTEELILEWCTQKTLERAREILRTDLLSDLRFDGTYMYGVVQDGKVCRPTIDFNAMLTGCNCGHNEIGNVCAHCVALQLAWIQDFSAFMPDDSDTVAWKNLAGTSFSDFVRLSTGRKNLREAVRVMKVVWEGRLKVDAPPTPQITPAPTRNSGEAFWPVASTFIPTLFSLTQTLEAEFNTTQLRELARVLGVKLKGTSKSGFTEQVSAAIAARVEHMRENPDVLLLGLSDEMAQFARRAFTARGADLPLSRTLATALWGQQANRDAGIQINTVLDTLRRYALLFPSRVYYGGRDVNYQWLPLDAAHGNLPLMTWPPAKLPLQAQPQHAASPAVNFLDAFDLFINAVLSTGTEVRASLPTHELTSRTAWLREWEHDAEEAERVIKSRPGWVPSATTGISVPLLSPLTDEARLRLENQTGLPGEQCEFLFSIAAALQLVEAADPQSASAPNRGMFVPLRENWHVDARTKSVEEWLALPDAMRLMLAWNIWLNSSFFIPEIRRASQRTGFQVMRAIGVKDFKPGDLADEWCALRRFVTRVLRCLPVGEWVSWHELRHQIFKFHPTCAWSMTNSDTWWFSPVSKLSRLEANRSEDFQHSVGACIENMLTDSLYWFGLLELDANSKGLQAFRLMPLRDWMHTSSVRGATNELPALPAVAAQRPRLVQPVTWLSDMQWRLPPAPDRAEFIAFVRKIGEPANAPFTYALSPASIERALAQGITVDAVAAQFESFGAPMPAAARALYQSIADHFGRVRIYPELTLLQLADDFALRELLSNTTLAQHIVYQISPRAVVIHADAVDELKREMVARGYTPGEK